MIVAERDIELELMKTAYGLLYETENSIRLYIRRKMEDYYGIHWYEVAPRKEYNRPPLRSFDTLSFTDYSSYFAIYPKAFKKVPREFLTLLHQLYPIRNKIAHNHLLTHEDFDLLKENVAFLIQFMKDETYSC